MAKSGFIISLGLILMFFKTASAYEELSNTDAPPQDLATPLNLNSFEVREHCFDTHSNPPIVRLERFLRFTNFNHYWNAEVFVVTIMKDDIRFVAQLIQGAGGAVSAYFEKRDGEVVILSKEDQDKRLKKLLPPEYFNAEGQLEMKNFSKCAP